MPWSLLAAAAVAATGFAVQGYSGSTPAPSKAGQQFTETIDGTTVSFVMKPVPAGRSAPSGAAEAPIGPFWISETEVTWNAYDLFVFGRDEPEGVPVDPNTPDAVTRPSKPYIPMDRGFGHAGYPAISMSYHGARSFCIWLSARTGRHYRLPTEREWRYVCGLGAVDAARVGEHAWFRGNADATTHPVATRQPDALGLHDVYGNASEWCTGAEGEPVTIGGTYRDGAEKIGCAARVLPTAAWNARDPQFPKSIWWLADAGFVGFRLVCEPPPHPGEEP
ncbi:MAG: formylglycine-generating enzyme family protein [Planctomycetota bacterium]|jgi:formylglycine-generating enzyme required for sulfatase activity